MGLVYKTIAFLVIVLSSYLGSAQTSPLDNKVRLQVVNTTLQQTLFLLAEEGNFSFAYNSDLIHADSLINYTAEDITVREVLNQLLGFNISYTAVDNHIILKYRDFSKNTKPGFTISGQILSAKTGSVIEDATIYSNVKLKSDITDNSGNYKLNLNNRQPLQIITISKVGYQDTTLEVRHSEIYNLNIQLVPDPLFIDTTEKVEGFRFVNFFTNRKQRTNAFNIKDSINRIAQASVVPMVGTNKKMSGSITNNISFNFLGGYNGGLKGVELGFGFNIVRDLVKGIQIGCIGNTAGGNVYGVQIGGIYNLNLKQMKGFQASGFVNIQRRSFTGFQASGGVNYADTLRGWQMSMINIVRKETDGVQIGVVNYTKKLKGIQFGVINIADTANGTPIGLLSIVRKGYLHFDVYGDELNHGNIALRTGVQKFHNIITFGFTWDDANTLWRLGYGLGTELSMGKRKKGFTNFDLTVSYINRGKTFTTDLNLVSILNWDLGVRFKKHFAFFFGPTFKVYTSQHQNPDTGNYGLDIAWNPQYSSVNNGVLNEVWVGVRGGFRF